MAAAGQAEESSFGRLAEEDMVEWLAEEDMVERLAEEDIARRLRAFELCDNEAVVGESCTDSEPSHMEEWINNEEFRDDAEASKTKHNDEVEMYDPRAGRAYDQVVDDEEDMMLIQLDPNDISVDEDILYMRVASGEYEKRYISHMWSST